MTPARLAQLRAAASAQPPAVMATGIAWGEVLELVDAAEGAGVGAQIRWALVKVSTERDALQAKLDALHAELRAAGAMDE